MLVLVTEVLGRETQVLVRETRVLALVRVARYQAQRRWPAVGRGK